MTDEFLYARIALMIISVAVISYVTNKKIKNRLNTQPFVILVVFWFAVFVISLNPGTLDDLLQVTGLENRAQFLLIATILVLLYLLYSQISKNKNLSLDFNRIISEIAISNFKQNASLLKDSIVLIIPAYNEVKSLPTVLNHIPNSLLGHNVTKIVIDDGSEDETYKVAINNNAFCLKHETNLGQGSAILTGINFASKYNPKILVTFDADGQHDVKDLELLIKPVLSGDCDMAVGSRFMGQQEYSNTERLVGIHFFTNLINFLCGSKISDCTNGFRAINPRILEKIKLKEKKFSAPEILIETILKGFKIQNIPTTIKRRTAGKTKKPRIGFAIGLFRVIIVTWLRNKI